MGHLADLLKRLLLEQMELLAVGALRYEFVHGHCPLLRSRHLLSLNVPLLEAGEHVTEEVKVFLGALTGQHLRHMIVNFVEGIFRCAFLTQRGRGLKLLLAV